MAKRYAIVLAAGQGTRMKSKLYKVLHPVLGRPMVQHVIDNVKKVQLEDIVTIVGHGAEKVKEHIGDKSQFVIQEEQLGTGHACMQAEDLLKDKKGSTIVVCGDTPLISSETYQALFEFHEQENAQATVLTAKAPNPNGYGRVLRDDENQVVRIVEHKDANEQERFIDEINTGTYCFDNQALFTALKKVNNNNAQNEYYLPDVIEILKDQADKVSAFMTADFDETMGVNDRVALSEAERVMKRRINELHMRNGVTIIDPDHTYIEPNVIISQDVVIYPGTTISGQSQIKENAEVGPNAEIVESIIGENAVIKQSVIKHSTIEDHVNIGPYAHIRPETKVGTNAKVGNFVELKKATIGENSKVSHLSYMGDTVIGSNVNIGCGTITVNYDGKDKHLTEIKDDAFVGCNSNLIAPVTIGKGAYVAAGSTITNDVPDKSLSIARSRQTNKEGYAKNIRGNKQ